MKNNDNPVLLAHLRKVQKERRDAAVAAKRKETLAAMRKVGGAK